MAHNSSLPEEIQNLGRKARARLEVERSKRREIHRVEILPPEAQRNEGPKPPQHSALIDAANLEVSKKVAKAAPKKRKRAGSKKSESRSGDYIVDRWMPDVSQIPLPASKDTRSSLVQLHGLPLASTTSHVLRFFSGLDPQRVLYVPTMTPRSARVQELDALSNSQRRVATVDRHEPCTTRIFVKFDSAPTAALAVQRSGEVLPLTDQLGATIAVTNVVKKVASYVLKNLAIDVVDGASIEHFCSQVDSKLDPVIPMVLWEATISDLRLHVDVEPGDHTATARSFRTELNAQRPATQHDKSKLETHITKLAMEIDRLQSTLPFPSTDALDPVWQNVDPILNLTCKCVATLQWELERSRALLAMSRRWSLLTSSRFKLKTD